MNRELASAGAGLVGNGDVLRGILSGCGDCIKILDLDGRLQFMSDGGKRVMEVDDFETLKGCPWPDFWSGGGNTQARTRWRKPRPGARRASATRPTPPKATRAIGMCRSRPSWAPTASRRICCRFRATSPRNGGPPTPERSRRAPGVPHRRTHSPRQEHPGHGAGHRQPEFSRRGIQGPSATSSTPASAAWATPTTSSPKQAGPRRRWAAWSKARWRPTGSAARSASPGRIIPSLRSRR